MRIFNIFSILCFFIFGGISGAGIIAGPIVNSSNGHLYYLLSANTWTASEVEAVSLGGHLVTINDAAENDWVCGNFLMYEGAARALWIGLFQPSGSQEPSGGWKWASGETPAFLNWTPQEPNNNTSRGPQNWAMIFPPTAASVVPYAARKWNDTWDLKDTGVDAQWLYGLHGVVEVIPSEIGAPVPADIRTAVEIGWQSRTGKYYKVQWSDDLSPSSWQNLSGLVRSSGPMSYYYDSTHSSSRRFYRVVELP